MTELRQSGVDKQGKATVMINIGGFEGNNETRYLYIPKNKINNVKNWKKQVKYDSLRTRFLDVD
jgi:hypothetical protein